MRVMKRDEKEYKRLRSNYRNKLWRIRRKTDFSIPAEEIDKELGLYFPTIKEFREGAFGTRKNFNQFKKRVEQVTDRNFQPLQISENKGGMRYPRIIETFGKRHAKRAQQMADKQIDSVKDLPLIIDGEERGSVLDREIASTDAEAYGIFRPSDFDIDDYTQPESVERRIDKDKERSDVEYYDERKEIMLENYISIFEGKSGVPQDIVEKLRQITPRQFYEIYLMIPEMAFENWDSESGFHITGDTDAFEYNLMYYLDLYLDGGIDLPLTDIG